MACMSNLDSKITIKVLLLLLPPSKSMLLTVLLSSTYMSPLTPPSVIFLPFNDSFVRFCVNLVLVRILLYGIGKFCGIEVELGFFNVMKIGDLKRAIVEKTGLEVEHQKLLFRGQEKEDNERLDDCGVRENSKVLVLEEAVVSNEERREEVMEDSEAMRKALLAVAGVRAEVDQLSERVCL